MKAAVLVEPGTPPRYGDFDDPVPGQGQAVVEVAAAGVHHLDLARASGAFGEPRVPSVVGSDGVGRTADGRRVFFDGPIAPYGSWAQRALVSEAELLEPADGVDDVTAAALGNTAVAAWLALSWRAALQPGETVLVLGASGALGSIAVQAARAQGASRIIAADRDPDRLQRSRERGADAVVVLDGGGNVRSALREAAGAEGVDVIIDPVWGEPALAAMLVAARGARHIQIGHSAGPTIELPATVVRASRMDIRSFAIFDVSMNLRREAYHRLTAEAARGAITVDTIPVPLADVADAWRQQKKGAHAKLVLTP